jgi:cob(I)alamin adenosyltransferase
VTRRAERLALPVAPPPSLAVVYLNRLSDLLWTIARWQEGQSRLTRSVADPDAESHADPHKEHE